MRCKIRTMKKKALCGLVRVPKSGKYPSETLPGIVQYNHLVMISFVWLFKP